MFEYVLIAVDLDGVVAIEDRDKYFAAKAEGVSALRNYYKTLKPDLSVIKVLTKIKELYPWVCFNIYTARQNDLADIKQITLDWLEANVPRHLFFKVVFTKFAWKYEVLRDGCHILIDNDIVHLSRLPFINRIAYKSFFRENKSPFLNCIISDYPGSLYNEILWMLSK